MPLSFRPYLGITGRYDTNLAVLGSGASGASGNRYGLQGNWGINGVHRGERDVFGLDYRGHYRTYFPGSRSGTNQFLTFDWMRQLSARTSFVIAPSVATYSFALTGWRSPIILDTMSLVNDPDTEATDNRTYVGSVFGGLRHQLSQRWSIHAGGGGFYVSRQANPLYDSQGGSASVGASYQLGPGQHVRFSGSFHGYFYPNGFGSSKTTTVSVDYGRRLSQRWHMELGVGGIRNESERLQAVEIDPIIAAITGQDQVLEAFHKVTYRPAFRATVGRQFENSALSFYYRRSVHPGNGFIAGSIRDEAGSMYSYMAAERLNVGFNFIVSSHLALLQTVGRYNSYGGGGGINYALWKFVHLTARADVRRWQVRNSVFTRDRLALSVGLTFSPGSVPLSIW